MKGIKLCAIATAIILSYTFSAAQDDTTLVGRLKNATKEEKVEIYSQLVDQNFNVDNNLCLEYAIELEKNAKKTGNTEAETKACEILAVIYFGKNDMRSATKYFEKELGFREANGISQELAESYYNLGASYTKIPDAKKAMTNYEKSLQLAKQLNFEPLIIACHKALIPVYSSLTRYQEALNSLKEYVNIVEGGYSEEIALFKSQLFQEIKVKEQKIHELNYTQNVLNKTEDQLVETEEQVVTLAEDTLKKSMEIEQLSIEQMYKQLQIEKKEQELKQERLIKFIFIIGFGLILLLSVFLFRLFVLNKRKNKRLMIQQTEILKQNEQIKKQNHEITQSITYASRIQGALMPTHDNFSEIFTEHFIMYKPRDIVSGDFYFLQKVNDNVLFAAVDCTGHGVPGAFMSMLGIAFLTEIIRRKDVTSASEVLNLLRENVKESLKQTGKRGEQRDGMDMALCALNMKNKELQYAGAYNPLLILRKGEVLEYKGDKMPVGVHPKEKDSFTNHVVKLKKDDRLYMFSDGFVDQVGGPSGEKFMTENFRNLLLEVCSLPMAEQHIKLDETFTNWSSGQKQVDDIVIIGLKI
ncbi:MAG: SpoIIE family protein phosphatase [Bacteroidota bacterium]